VKARLVEFGLLVDAGIDRDSLSPKKMLDAVDGFLYRVFAGFEDQAFGVHNR
jgi:hypothetical protein